jgi:hypothetical protein
MVMPVTVEMTVTGNIADLLWSVEDKAVTVTAPPVGMSCGAVKIVVAPLTV